MGLFDSLFGGRPPVVGDPEQLRTLLFDAAAAGDQKRFDALCRANQDAIVRLFPEWQKVPESIRKDPAAVPRFAQGLIAVARHFAERLGRPELLQRLKGTPEDNPLWRWQEALRQTQAMMQELRYQEAAGRLSDLLIDVRELQGSGADAYLPLTYGRLGECYFQAGEAAKAVAPTRQALELCEKHGDVEGVIAYHGNLYEIHRYLGEAGPAAEHAERLAGVMVKAGREDDAAWYRKQAPLVRAGEPLNRVVALVGERRYELDDVPLVKDGRVQFLFERNRVSLQPSRHWTQRGEKHGGAGEYDQALAAFREAARADPYDPHPRFLAGLTLMNLQRAAEAADEYAAAEELAPGWFHCRADLWLAREIALGRLEHRAFLALFVIEDGQFPPEQKVQFADRVLAEIPDFPAIHLHRGRNLAALGRKAEAQEAYRRGLACAAEPDVRTRLLVELAVSHPVGEERTRLLREAVALNGNLVAAATAALCLRNES